MGCPNHDSPYSLIMDLPQPVVMARYRLDEKRKFIATRPPREITCELCKRDQQESKA